MKFTSAFVVALILVGIANSQKVQTPEDILRTKLVNDLPEATDLSTLLRNHRDHNKKNSLDIPADKFHFIVEEEDSLEINNGKTMSYFPYKHFAKFVEGETFQYFDVTKEDHDQTDLTSSYVFVEAYYATRDEKNSLNLLSVAGVAYGDFRQQTNTERKEVCKKKGWFGKKKCKWVVTEVPRAMTTEELEAIHKGLHYHAHKVCIQALPKVNSLSSSIMKRNPVTRGVVGGVKSRGVFKAIHHLVGKTSSLKLRAQIQKIVASKLNKSFKHIVEGKEYLIELVNKGEKYDIAVNKF